MQYWCIFYAHTGKPNDIRPAVPSRGPSRGIFRDQPAPTNHIIGFGAPERRPWLGPRGLTNAFPRPIHQLHGSGGLGHCWPPDKLLRETLTNPGRNNQIVRRSDQVGSEKLREGINVDGMVRYSRARKVNPQNRGKEPSEKPLQPSCDRRDGSTHDIIAHLTRFMVNFNARFCLDARALGIEDTSILYFTSLLLRIDDSLVP